MDTEEAECPADRPSVTDDARAESERRYNSAALHSDLTYPAHALESHRRGAFVAGAEWAAGRAETTTEPCCAHPKCPGGSLCCCQDDPADRPSVTDDARATFDARFQHYDGYTSPARQDDLYRVFQSGMQYADSLARHTPGCSAVWMAVGGCTCAEQEAAARAETQSTTDGVTRMTIRAMSTHKVSSQAGVASMRAGRVYSIGADGVPREKQPQRLPTRDDIATKAGLTAALPHLEAALQAHIAEKGKQMTDHYAETNRLIDGLHNLEGHNADFDMALAQTHAVLALAEQQRIANLIAYMEHATGDGYELLHNIIFDALRIETP